MKRSALLACCLFFASVCALSGRTWYITPDGDGDAPTIQAGIDSAGFFDTVLLEDGVYVGEGNHDIIWKDRWRWLTVASASGDPEQCVIDCNPTTGFRRGFIMVGMTDEETVLEGIKIANAWTAELGSAMYCDTSACLMIRNCIFENNEAFIGGAIYCVQASPRIVDCTFRENRSSRGGAVYAREGQVYISDCTFVSNRAGLGETSTGLGGAVYVDVGNVTLRACTFVENSAAHDGGVLYCWTLASVGIYGSTLHRNACGRLGSAVYCYQSNDIFCMDTIIASGEGGEAIRLAPAGNTAVIECTDIFGNDGGDWTGDIEALLGTDGNFSACPSFCFAGDGDLRLCDQSPCAPGNHPDGYSCGLIGAWPVGCSCGPTQNEPATWGAIKAIYR